MANVRTLKYLLAWTIAGAVMLFVVGSVMATHGHAVASNYVYGAGMGWSLMAMTTGLLAARSARREIRARQRDEMFSRVPQQAIHRWPGE